MHRGSIGTYDTSLVSGEVVRAFVPRALPPQPSLAIDGPLHLALLDAAVALGRLDAVTALLPDSRLFLYSYVRKEATVSSQIEGTQSSLSTLMLFELGEAPGVPMDDVAEVSNYVSALEHGMSRLAGDFPLSNRLLREMHGILLASGRGSGMAPGEFRRSQNWIGGSRPGNAVFVPPPHTRLLDCMGDLERFIHANDDGIHAIVRALLAHVQFETIHPFLDGNGRIGRLLITLMLSAQGVLRQPLLYLSLYFKLHRTRYYDLLEHVRATGDWEEWLVFALEGVRATAASAVDTAERLAGLFAADRAAIEGQGTPRTVSVLRVHNALKARPVATASVLREQTELSLPTIAAAIRQLTELGIVHEVTGRRWRQVFAYSAYVDILSEDTEPL